MCTMMNMVIGHMVMNWYFCDEVFERYNVKRIALRQSPCRIPKVAVLLFYCFLLAVSHLSGEYS